MEEGLDFGLWEQILEKLSSGGALTPEEKAAYDALFAGAGEGLDLTGSPDFQKLVQSYYTDVSGSINDEFSKAYGENLVKGPNGQISFSRPGSLVENFLRRGLSINDGPVMALLSEGLGNRDEALDRARLNALSAAYRDMVPVRQQNQDAIYRAGLLAQGGANRRVQSMGGARRASGGEGPSGPEPPKEPIRMPLPDEPSMWERILPGLLGAGTTGAIALGRDLLGRNRPMDKNNPDLGKGKGEVPLPPMRPYPSNDPYDAIENQRAGGLPQGATGLNTSNPLSDEEYIQSQMMGPGMGAGAYSDVNAAAPAFTPAATFTPPTQLPGLGADIMTGASPFNPYVDMGWGGQQNNYVEYPQYNDWMQPQQQPSWESQQEYSYTPQQDYYYDDPWQGWDWGGGDYGGSYQDTYSDPGYYDYYDPYGGAY